MPHLSSLHYPTASGMSSSIKGAVSDKPEGEFPRPTKCPGFDWGILRLSAWPEYDPLRTLYSALITHSTAEGMPMWIPSSGDQGLIFLLLSALFTHPLSMKQVMFGYRCYCRHNNKP
ncbi:hypothetical protein CEXT_375351 [Caerostris extrusa]|uniref:Uncharacterized protein n=1 Tax=Caerostris extrusa TaxID=172846 RepID=A0AAV4XH25_CAEEX|nr:hypothetical protein CEXT_375351 [Caerostris extrusa]